MLDGRLRSKEFMHFMRERVNTNNDKLGISAELLQLIKICLQELADQYPLACVVPLPSKTWGARNVLAELLAEHLNIPVFPDLLHWRVEPAARQGELLNNDQRQHNVAGCMQVKCDAKKLAAGTILLLDDYTGSGATLNEAARALRQSFSIQYKILPFAIAAVKCRLGKRGMV